MENGMFYRPRQFFRAIICLSIAVCLFILSNANRLEPAKSYLDGFTNRIFIFNQGANSFINNLTTNFKDIDTLSLEYEDLQKEVVLLKNKLSRYKAIEEENIQLKKILNIKSIEVARSKVVDVINTEQGSKNNIIFINKGEKDGLFIGQNIYDAQGVLGQIISISENSSRVLLITDNNSYIPAFNVNNNDQYVVRGNNSKELEVLFFKPKSTLSIGDYIYTSGIGEKYIPNYPLAIISKIIRDSNNNILSVYARPLAQLNSLRFMVAVWPYCKSVSKSRLLRFDKSYRSKYPDHVLFKKEKNFLNYRLKELNLDDFQALNLLNYTDALRADQEANAEYGSHNCFLVGSYGNK